MKNLNIIQNLLIKNKGIITSKEIAKNNIARQYIKNMVDSGKLEKVARGVYIDLDVMEDEYFTIQSIYSKAIFSNETALFLHGISDRLPLVYDVTLPKGYNPTNISKKYNVNTYITESKFYDVGVTEVLSPHGKKLKVYNLEKTICDIIKNEKKIDKQIFVDAIRMYVRKKDKDLILLNKYAKLLKIEAQIKTYLEVLL